MEPSLYKDITETRIYFPCLDMMLHGPCYTKKCIKLPLNNMETSFNRGVPLHHLNTT